MMISRCVIAVLIAISCLTRDAHSQTTFSGVVPMWETTVHEILPCGTVCLLTKFPEVYTAGKTCADAMVNEIQTYINANLQGLSYSQIYNRIITPSGSQSVVCGWFRTHTRCFERQMSSICGQRIQNSVRKLFQDLEDYACSTSPPFLQCLMDPMFIENNSPALTCIQTLANVFQPYFSGNNNNGVQAWQNVYNALITPANGLLFRSVKTFGTCIGRVISTLSRNGCNTIGSRVESLVAEGVDYVDHGIPGSKDYVKCFANPKLWPEMEACGVGLVEGFGRDPTFNTSINNPRSTQNIGDTVLQQLQSRNVEAFNPHFMKFSACVKTSVLHSCGRGSSSYEVVRRILTPLDEYFFNQYDQSFRFPRCGSDSFGGGGGFNSAPKTCRAISDVLLLQLTSLMTGVWRLV